ncbi:MAG: DUF971 domain-containing protein [Pedosphaera sp.]|nr:DUF971 domain-containing protein [Pedosphaera sp.]
MQPADCQVIGTELAIRWSGGAESFITLETLRRFCPCAACMGEQDIFGKTYLPPARPYGPDAFRLQGLEPVGGYAIQPRWADGHRSGLYSWEYLKRVAEAST